MYDKMHCYLCDSILGKRTSIQLVCEFCGRTSHMSCNAMFPEETLSCCVMCRVNLLPTKVKENTNIMIVHCPIMKDKFSQTSNKGSIRNMSSQTSQEGFFEDISSQTSKEGLFEDIYSQTSKDGFIKDMSSQTSESIMENPIHKNLTKYFTDFDIPQIVILYLGSPGSKDTLATKFICNSVILAIHSEKFESLLSAGSSDIYLEGFSSQTDVVRKSIEYMYGNHPVIDEQVEIIDIMKFATVWSISSLSELCLATIETKINTNPLELIDFLPSLDFLTDKSKLYLKTMTTFKNVIKIHADKFIDLFVKDKALLETLMGRLNLFQTLIENSYSPQCVIFMTSLLSASERSKRAVLKSLHLIQVDSIFSGAISFAMFHDFLYSYCVILVGGNEEDLENIRTLKSRADTTLSFFCKR